MVCLFLFNICLFIYLAVSGLSCGSKDLCCGTYQRSNLCLALQSQFFLFFFNFICLLYNTVLVLPYIDMNPLQMYTSSQP